MKSRILLCCLVVLLAAALSLAAAPDYHLANTIKLGGTGGWDYLLYDPVGNRIFISRSDHVVVVDPSGKELGQIADTQGVHGIALAQDLGKGFTSNGRAGALTVFDLKSLQTTGSVKAGENPDAITYDDVTHRVFAFNGRSKDATAVDAASGSVAGTIPLGGKPETGVPDGKGKVYVNIEDTGEIAELDAKELKLLNRWKIAPCEEPSGLAMDTKSRRLFAGCGNKMMAIVDADSGKVLATPAIGQGVDACGFDPERKLAFSSNGEGTLTVIHEDSPNKFTVVQTVQTVPRARTMTLDPKSHNIYLVTADFNPAPAPTAETPRPRPTMAPDSFKLLVVTSK